METENIQADQTGASEVNTQSVETTPNVVNQNPVEAEPTEKEVEQPDDKATTDRLKQQNARQAKLLSSLGVDPLSDLGEQLESGLITPDMVKNHILGSQRPAEAAPSAPTVDLGNPLAVAQEEYRQAKIAYDKETEEGSISITTNSALLNTIQKLNDAKLENLTRQITAEKQSQQVSESVEAVLNVARSNPEYVQMGDNLKQASDTVNIAMTGILADREAQKMGIDPATLTRQQYEYFAKKASEQLGELANFYIEMGQKQVRDNLQPQTRKNNFPPAPAGASGTGVTPANPYAAVTHSNHKEAALQFARNVVSRV